MSRIVGRRGPPLHSPPMAVTASNWTPSSWRELPVSQQPEWPDATALAAVRERLSGLPPLVFAGEARALSAALGEVSDGRAFLLQAGDCVESFRDVSAPAIREKLKVLLQMSAVLTYGATLARRQGRAHRRPVREAPERADGDRERGRDPLVPRPRRPLRRGDPGGARPRPGAARAGRTTRPRPRSTCSAPSPRAASRT